MTTKTQTAVIGWALEGSYDPARLNFLKQLYEDGWFGLLEDMDRPCLKEYLTHDKTLDGDSFYKLRGILGEDQ